MRKIIIPNKFKKMALNLRLESIAWGLFLVMIGILWLYPEGRFPEDTWLIGVGIILVGLNAVRRFYSIHMSGFTLLLGLLAFLAGIDEYLGVEIPILAVLLIIIGLSILLFRPKWQCWKGWDEWFEQ